MTIPLGEGAVVRVVGGEKEERPGVVLRVFVREGIPMVFVAFGTGQPPRGREPPVIIEPGTAVGFTLGIYKTTYFGERNRTVCRAESVQPRGVLIQPRVLLDLKRLFGL